MPGCPLFARVIPAYSRILQRQNDEFQIFSLFDPLDEGLVTGEKVLSCLVGWFCFLEESSLVVRLVCLEGSSLTDFGVSV